MSTREPAAEGGMAQRVRRAADRRSRPAVLAAVQAAFLPALPHYCGAGWRSQPQSGGATRGEWRGEVPRAPGKRLVARSAVASRPAFWERPSWAPVSACRVATFSWVRLGMPSAAARAAAAQPCPAHEAGTLGAGGAGSPPAMIARRYLAGGSAPMVASLFPPDSVIPIRLFNRSEIPQSPASLPSSCLKHILAVP